MSQTQRIVECNGRKITLIGTAHVSKESVEEVKETIKTINPDCVAVELDEKRADSIQNSEKYKELDIVQVLKRGEGFLLIANLILASFQRKMGQNVGVKPGDEMLAAIEVAKELNIPTALVDRPIQITLRRAWAKNGFMGRIKLLSTLIASAFSKEEVSAEEIEKLKKQSEMDSMMTELAEYMPVIKEVLIDERDKYLATNIWNSQGNNVVAVLGAGHLPGVEAHLIKMSKNEEVADNSEISSVPPKKVASKIAGWIIPTIVIAVIVAGFIYGGTKAGSMMLTTWFLWNGIPAAIGTTIALAHPITVIVAFFTAPFTSLCPFIGVGFVTGIVQAIVQKPKVTDIETLQDNISLKGFYKNRILKVLMVFVLSSLGSSIGTFIGGADIIGQLADI
ncbi:MAG: TraB/GumN family protein [Treponema bryantii]|nr:TraB/GumN family protein [Treponema bryantii]